MFPFAPRPVSAASRLLLFGLLCCVAAPAVAADPPAEPDVTPADHPYRAIHAARTIGRYDKDGDGAFGPGDGAGRWRSVAEYDADGDGLVSESELAAAPIPYLPAAGGRDLNVLYKSTPQGDLYLDLYRPAADAPGERDGRRPLAIYIHGGGWLNGNKQLLVTSKLRPVYERLLDAGYCVAAFDYRLCEPGSGVTIRDCVVDVKDALRFLSADAERFGVDPHRVVVSGTSAGAHLAQMLALTEPRALPGEPDLANVAYTVRAAVSWYGPTDFEKTELFDHDGKNYFRENLAPRLFGPDPLSSEEETRRSRAVSPVQFLHPANPPLLLIQGDSDPIVPLAHAAYMKERAEAVGAPVELLVVKKGDHGWWGTAGTPLEPSVDAIVDRTFTFLTAPRTEAD